MTQHVFDTSYLIGMDSVKELEQCPNAIIPSAVLKELDKHKSRPDNVGAAARTVSRFLFNYLTSDSTNNNIRIIQRGNYDVADEEIVAIVASGGDCIVYTDDVLLAIRCVGVNEKVSLCSNFLKGSTRPENVLPLATPRVALESVVKRQPGALEAIFEANPGLTFEDLHEGRFVVLRDESSSVIARMVDGELEPVEDIPNSIFGCKPKNLEQKIAAWALTNEDIHLVTIAGAAGSGKTLVSLACGLEQVMERKKYDKVVLIKPNVPIGEDIGFLPGNFMEKMSPWMASTEDNLKVLMKKIPNPLATLLDKEYIEVEALAYVRGRSISNSFIIIDECQNLDKHQIKTLLTRAGHGSKMVLLGDPGQIDNRKLSKNNNGLRDVIDLFRGSPLHAHIQMVKCERSPLAKEAIERFK